MVYQFSNCSFMKYLLVCFLFFGVACSSHPQQELSDMKYISDASNNIVDTVVTYDIEGISDEGAETTVTYENSKISKSVTNVFWGTGKVIIVFDFETDVINVLETKFSYTIGIEDVKSENDMQLDYEYRYSLDYEGNLQGEVIQERIDIFKVFKDIVPFKLE